jgi:hypothetical protein
MVNEGILRGKLIFFILAVSSVSRFGLSMDGLLVYNARLPLFQEANEILFWRMF